MKGHVATLVLGLCLWGTGCPRPEGPAGEPRTVEDLLERAHQHAMKREFEQSITDHSKVIEIEPDQPGHYLERSRTWCSMGEWDRAIADLDRAVELDPGNGTYLIERGGARALAGYHELALRDLDAAVALRPQDPRAHMVRGVCLRLMERDDSALESFDRAVELDPVSVSPVRRRGLLHLDRGEYIRAARDLARAVELWKGDDLDVNDRILLYVVRTRSGTDGKPDLEALAEKLRRHADANDGDKWLAWRTMLVGLFLGEVTPEVCLSAATHPDPRTELYRKGEAYYYTGQLYLLRGEKALAAEMFRKYLDLDAMHLYEYASARAQLNRLENAQFVK